MFENVLKQDRIISRLKNEIAAGTLPQSLLFYGDSYSGKLTAALELARVLTCEKGSAVWGCQCASCRMHLTLEHPFVLMAGPRYFKQEIEASADVMLRTMGKPSQYMLTRNVRKLIKRYDPALWREDDTRIKKVKTSLNTLEELLEEIQPEKELPIPKKVTTLIKKILDHCDKLIAQVPKGNIPINIIRNINYWSRRSAGGKKIVILENADLMQEGSRNSLLKVLEEPPADTYFILLAEKKSTVLPTILSRVRTYSFKARDIEGSREIIQKIFREEREKFASLKEYFYRWLNVEPGSQTEKVKHYFFTAFNREGTFARALPDKIDADVFLYFLEELTCLLKRCYLGEEGVSLPLQAYEQIMGFIRDKVIQYKEFNQNPQLLTESLYYEITGVVREKVS